MDQHSRTAQPFESQNSNSSYNKGFPIVGIGASAGGLEAFDMFFKEVPQECGMAFVLVVHLDPTHVSMLPELLQKSSKIPVIQAQDGMPVEVNHAYVIPPNKELSILNGVLRLMEITRSRGSNLPIDSFLRSLAKDQGSNAICIILSGTGSDGTLGLKEIKKELGLVVVQDEKSAKYNGMPHNAIMTNLVDCILIPEKIPDYLSKYAQFSARKLLPVTLDSERIENACYR